MERPRRSASGPRLNRAPARNSRPRTASHGKLRGWTSSSAPSHECLITVTTQQSVVGRILVEIAQRRVIETRAVEQVRRGISEHGDQANMNHFGGLLAENVHAYEAHVIPSEEQFQETG